MDIQYDQVPSGEWRALDANEYDAECDSNGWWSASLVGYGATKEAALADLLAEIEDRADEDDGQPSEAQEWSDYDRDC